MPVRLGSTTRAIASRATTKKVYCWGTNGYGQVGDGTTNPSLAATPVLTAANTPLSNVVELRAQYLAHCALTGTGNVMCWGYTNNGTQSYATALSVTNVHRFATGPSNSGTASLITEDANGTLTFQGQPISYTCP